MLSGRLRESVLEATVTGEIKGRIAVVGVERS